MKVFIICILIAICLTQAIESLKLKHAITYGHVKLYKKDFKCEPWPYTVEKKTRKKKINRNLEDGKRKI